jgi:hypothetical protein
LQRIFLAAVTALLLSLGSAAAEPTSTEQRIRDLAQKLPTSSVVFMEVRVLEEGKERDCADIKVGVVSDEGFSTTFFAEKTNRVFGHVLDGAQYGGIVFLPPGTYTVISIECQTVRLSGRFARFRVGANEMINTGCLVIDYKKGPFTLLSQRTFDGRTSVEDLGARATQSIAERTPNVFPKATKRYMAPNPAISGKRP